MIKKLYHQILRVVLRLVGLDFSWYRTFHFRVIYALSIVEPLIQATRPRSRVEEILGGPEVLRCVTPGDTVLDLGANVGNITSLLLGMGLTVHAFEPDSRCVALLRRRFKLFARERLHIHQIAVSNEPGMVKLHYGLLTTESNSILTEKPGADGSAGAEFVEARSILDILDSIGYVPLIKMDIEGAEYDVLEVLLRPENLTKFGVCLVEDHAKKIPSLMPRQMQLEETIVSLGLTDRVLLTWH